MINGALKAYSTKHENQRYLNFLKSNRSSKCRRNIAQKSESSSQQQQQQQQQQKEQKDLSKFVPAHLRKTVSRITEKQLSEQGVELKRAQEQVQESIAGFLAFEFLRARVKNVPSLRVMNVDPPVLVAWNFLSDEECDAISVKCGVAASGERASSLGSSASDDNSFEKVSGLSAMKKAELVSKCEERGLDFSGTVSALRDRLREFNEHSGDSTSSSARGAASPSTITTTVNTEAKRERNPQSLINAETRSEAVNQLLKRLNYLFPDCVEDYEDPSARKENKPFGIDMNIDCYKSKENLRATHAAFEQHEAIEKQYQVRAKCVFFLNDNGSEDGGEITFPALPGLQIKPKKGTAFITFPSTAASLLDPRAATSRNSFDSETTLNAVEVLIKGATPKVLTEEEAAVERKRRHEEEKERARLAQIPRAERRKMMGQQTEEKARNSRKKTPKEDY